MFARRRPISEWSHGQIRQQVVNCYTSDPDSDAVRAVVVLHQDERLLPRNSAKQAAMEAAEAGEEFHGLPPYLAFAMKLDDEDRADVLLGGFSNAVQDYGGFASPREAAAFALEWIGPDATPFPFENIPGIYQAAFIEYVTGKPVEITPAIWMWALPATGDMVPVRQFPSRIDGE